MLDSEHGENKRKRKKHKKRNIEHCSDESKNDNDMCDEENIREKMSDSEHGENKRKRKKHKKRNIEHCSDESKDDDDMCDEENVKGKMSDSESEESKKKRKKHKKLNSEHCDDNPDEEEDETCSLYRQKCKSKRKKQFERLFRGTTFEITTELIERMKYLDIAIDWELSPLHVGTIRTLLKDELLVIEAATGVTPKTTVWTFEELKILAENWKQFRLKYDITNPLLLLGLDKEKDNSRTLKLNFIRYMAKELDRRPLITVYLQCRRIFNPENYKGSLTRTEFKLLQRYRLKYGNKWTEIGRKMNRNPEILHYFNRAFEDNYKTGKWSTKEDESLIEAIKKSTGVEDLTIIDSLQLPWKEISIAVKTRSIFQCRSHWFQTLSNKIAHPAKDVSSKSRKKYIKFPMEDKMRLLERIAQGNYETEADIPWQELNEEFKLSTWRLLKSKYRLLRAQVPHHHLKTHQEIIDWFTENKLTPTKN